MKESAKLKSPNFNKNNNDSPTRFKQNLYQEPSSGIITKENIFACNLKFSDLFLNKSENQENDNEFIDHFEQLKTEKQEKQDLNTLSTHFTESNLNKDCQIPRENDINCDDINNNYLIKLIDSPKNWSTKESSQLKRKKIIITNNNVSSYNQNYANNQSIYQPGMQSHISPNSFNNNFNYPIPNFVQVPNMQQMPPKILIPFHQHSMPLPFPNSNAQYFNNFYRNNYIDGGFSNGNQVSPINNGNVMNTTPIPEVKSFTGENTNKQIITQPIFQKYTEMSEDELIQNCKELSKDQGGCRFLQKLLENSPKFSTALYNNLESDLISLLNDSFGNYLIQKLIEKLPIEIIDKIIVNITPYMINIGTNPHGTRVLQKLIEVLKPGDQQDKFIKAFSHCVITFSNDINGNHIIQKFITTVAYPKNQFLFDIIQKNIILVGLNKHGCCALQKCIEFGTEKQRNDMINSSIKHSRNFLTDKYGNYVLQSIISYQNYIAIRVITESFLKDILKLSKEKFSSNVVEKCMDYCDNETKEKILKRLAIPEYIPELLMDMYGNYVIQKALYISYEPYYSVFIENIGPILEKMKHLSFGAKLYTKLLNNYPELSEYVDGNNHYYDGY